MMSPRAQDHAHLARRTTRGAATMLAARFASALAGLGATAVLARFISPEEYGLVAMVLAAMALARAFEEVGLGDAMVQRTEVTGAQMSSLFWLNTLSGALLALVFALGAPLLATILGEADLAPFARALAPLFLLSALGAQHRAWLRRHLSFRALALAASGSVLVGALAGIVAAFAGLGPWALVVQQLAAATTLLAATWAASGLRPSRPALAEGLRPLLAYGVSHTGTQLVTAASRNIDTILLGRVAGPAIAGVYDRAFRTMALPATQLNQPVASAVVPALARLQNDPEGYRRLYRGAIECAASIAFPAAVFTFAAAPAIVGTLLGAQWSDAAPILRALAPCGLMMSLNAGTAWAYQSLGHTRRQLQWTILGSSVAIVAIVCGLPWGALGVAIGLSAARVAMRPFGVLYCFRGTFLSSRDLIEPSWRPACAAVVAGAAAYIVDPTQLSAPLRLCVQMSVFVFVALASMALIPGGLARLRASRAIVASLRAPRTEATHAN
ncbi:MAG: lipopolysaccharide biosynthesis protein [Planctomycetaceae bacterium]|nr:lipopolysaccharide biosynthesis protein [Planctomycetaceae bacterium]